MTNTYVDFTTNLGDIVIELYDNVAPLTVADFLSYAENLTIGAGYVDSFFHRLVAGFVLQGGGYDYTSSGVSTIATAAPVKNEYNASYPNVAGTVALAKLGSSPDSATDQFFINLADNSSNLDNQNGGFTVFGTVTPATWPVVEKIAALPVVDASGGNPSSPFSSLPIEGTIGSAGITAANLVIITNVSVSTTPPCYASGSRIKTSRGAVAVEDLRLGDEAITARGVPAPIRWIGRRQVDCSFHPAPHTVWPFRVAAHAFGQNLPERDLFLSPDHAVYVDDVLIPIKHLMNGRSISQIAVSSVEYWHVELDHHDIILAEGLPAESYLETGNREAFANGGDFIRLHPNFAPLTWRNACAELVESGPRLAAIKQRLFERAGCAAGRPDLALQVRAGRHLLAATIVAPGVWRYEVPKRARVLHLLSPVFVPASTDANSLDRRTLGVRLFAVDVGAGAIGLDDAAFGPGFHPIEATKEGACRWTNGRAQLVLPVGTRSITLSVGDDATPLSFGRKLPVRPAYFAELAAAG